MIKTVFFILALLVAFFDQLIKLLVAGKMLPGQSIPLIPSILHLTYVKNIGAAFGLFRSQRYMLIVIGVAVILAVMYFQRRVETKEYLIQTALAFILGGSFGNIIDRIFRGYVVDFIDFRFWPVFNLADIMINLGIFLLLLRILARPKAKI